MYRETWTVLSGWYNIYRESHLDLILKLRIPELVVLYYIPPTEMEGKKKRISFFFLYKIEIVDRLSVPYFSTCIDTLFLNQILLRRQFRSFDSYPQAVCGRTRMRLYQQMTPCHRRNNGQQLNWINSTRAGSFFFLQSNGGSNNPSWRNLI